MCVSIYNLAVSIRVLGIDMQEYYLMAIDMLKLHLGISHDEACRQLGIRDIEPMSDSEINDEDTE